MIKGDDPKTLRELPHAAWAILDLIAHHPGASMSPSAAVALHLERTGLATFPIVGVDVCPYPTELGSHLAWLRDLRKLDLDMRFDRYTAAKISAEKVIHGHSSEVPA